MIGGRERGLSVVLSEWHLKESSWLLLSDKAKVTEAEIKSSLSPSTLKSKEPQQEFLALHPKPFSEQNDNVFCFFLSFFF